jgi:hypothetical protein
VHNLTIRAKGKLLLENTSLTIAAGAPGAARRSAARGA